jgi:hypothetical protein
MQGFKMHYNIKLEVVLHMLKENYNTSKKYVTT